MPKEATEYPQVTIDQVELWLAHPVTKSLITALQVSHQSTVQAAGTGKHVDSSNADMTHALMHRSLGQQDVYLEVTSLETLLDTCGLIFYPPPPKDEDAKP